MATEYDEFLDEIRWAYTTNQYRGSIPAAISQNGYQNGDTLPNEEFNELLYRVSKAASSYNHNFGVYRSTKNFLEQTKKGEYGYIYKEPLDTTDPLEALDSGPFFTSKQTTRDGSDLQWGSYPKFAQDSHQIAISFGGAIELYEIDSENVPGGTYELKKINELDLSNYNSTDGKTYLSADVAISNGRIGVAVVCQDDSDLDFVVTDFSSSSSIGENSPPVDRAEDVITGTDGAFISTDGRRYYLALHGDPGLTSIEVYSDSATLIQSLSLPTNYEHVTPTQLQGPERVLAADSSIWMFQDDSTGDRTFFDLNHSTWSFTNEQFNAGVSDNALLRSNGFGVLVTYESAGGPQINLTYQPFLEQRNNRGWTLTQGAAGDVEDVLKTYDPSNDEALAMADISGMTTAWALYDTGINSFLDEFIGKFKTGSRFERLESDDVVDYSSIVDPAWSNFNADGLTAMQVTTGSPDTYTINHMSRPSDLVRVCHCSEEERAMNGESVLEIDHV